jgi:hypothetical protein
VKIRSEAVSSDIEGTIIDIETIGDFRKEYYDSRRYKDIVPVIFGFLTRDRLQIHCARTQGTIATLKQKIIALLPGLEKPFHAFNTQFEVGSLFHHLGEPVMFERELNKERYEAKRSAVRELGISNYDDPFNDDGLACKRAWLDGEINLAILHNRSCLLKERDLLLKRGFRESEELELVSHKA